MSTKAGVDLEEVGMKLFSEGWAGLEQTTMKVWGRNQLDGAQTPNISGLEGLALSLEAEHLSWCPYLKNGIILVFSTS